MLQGNGGIHGRFVGITGKRIFPLLNVAFFLTGPQGRNHDVLILLPEAEGYALRFRNQRHGIIEVQG